MGRPKGSKNKIATKGSQSAPDGDLKSKRGRPRKSKETAPDPSEPPRTLGPEIRTGLFLISGSRPWKIIKGPLLKFTDIKVARAALVKARDKEVAEGNNPYEIVLLPLGPKNEGLLP